MSAHRKYFTAADKHHARMYQAATSKKQRLRRGLCTSCPRRRERKDRLQCDVCRQKWNDKQMRRYWKGEAADRAKRTIRRGVRKLIRAIGRDAAQAFVRKAAA